MHTGVRVRVERGEKVGPHRFFYKNFLNKNAIKV
jgi:hypothetical protein